MSRPLTHLYRFESLTAKDIIGSNNFDSSTGTPTIETGFFGGSTGIHFNAAGENIYTSSDVSGINDTSGIISFFAKSDVTITNGKPAANKDWMYMFESGANDAFIFILNSGVGCRWNMFTDSTSHLWDSSPAIFDMTAGVWYHIVLYWDVNDSTKKRIICFNGQEAASNNTAWSLGSPWDIPFVLGSRTISANNSDVTFSYMMVFNEANTDLLNRINKTREIERAFLNDNVGLL
jgi:hypothetical protein